MPAELATSAWLTAAAGCCCDRSIRCGSVCSVSCAWYLSHCSPCLQTGGNGWFLVSRLKEELSGGSIAAAAGLQHAQQQQAQQGQQQEASPESSGPLAAASNELRERCVSRRSFKALTCMFDGMVTAAHLQDDMRVIHSVLQLAARIYRRPGGAMLPVAMLCSGMLCSCLASWELWMMHVRSCQAGHQDPRGRRKHVCGCS
jgi:hypothetical protein